MRSLIFLLLFSSQAFGAFVSQGTYQIGNGTNLIPRVPFYGLYDYSQSGMIYTASEIQEATRSSTTDLGGLISAMSLEFTAFATGFTVLNQTIKISHVLEDTIQGDYGSYYTYPDYRNLSLYDTTTVKENFTQVFSQNESWETLNFVVGFTWNGQDNILISWENRDGSWESGYGYVKGGGENGKSHAWYSDNSYPIHSSTHDGRSPNIRLTFEAANPVPLPAGITLFLSGLVGLSLMRDRNA